jgi:hypothetical protein
LRRAAASGRRLEEVRREGYKRDLGGNPIQLHTEGAAIYGGSCTPLFYDDAPHKPIDDTQSLLIKASTKDIADQWAREGSAGEATISATPPRRVASLGFAERGSSIRPPGLSGTGAGGLGSGRSPYANSSIASPMLSPVTDGGDGPTAAVASGSHHQPQYHHSPLRGWGSLPSHVPALGPAELSQAAMDQETRLHHRQLMNPHHLESKPDSAPNKIRPSEVHSFLDQVWHSKQQRMGQAEPLPYETRQKPVTRTADGAPIAPASMTLQDWKARAHREAMKPIYMSTTPSTDDMPLPTRTAPPNVTIFRPEATMENHTNASTRFREEASRRHADHEHAAELLTAIRSPVEYQMARGGLRRAGPSALSGFSPAERPQMSSHSVRETNDGSRRDAPGAASSSSLLMPSYDPAPTEEIGSARPPSGGYYGSVPSRSFTNDPIMQRARDERNPTEAVRYGDSNRGRRGVSAVMMTDYEPSPSSHLYAGVPSSAHHASANSRPRQPSPPRGYHPPGGKPAYLMDIVDALEV